MTIEFRTPTLHRATGGNPCGPESAESFDRRRHEVVVRRCVRPRPKRFPGVPALAEPRGWLGFPRTPLPETGTVRRTSGFPASFSTLFPPPAGAEGAGEGEGGAR